MLVLKLRYLAWFANLPTMFKRRGWFPYAAIVAMVPALVWLVFLLLATVRRVWREVLACAAWAFVGLLPVLFITQMPMKHNLYMPVAALALAVALLTDEAQQREGRMRALTRLPLGWVLASASLVLTTAFLLPGELKYSWVGEASDIARNSLDTVKRAYPTLPSDSVIYLLPTQVKGVTAWYFQQGALFNLFYRDRSLRMRFADQGASLPADFAYRSDIFIFRLHAGRLWDATREYKRDALDKASYRLLEEFPHGAVESRLLWETDDLPDNKGEVVLQALARNGQCRGAIIMVPGTTAKFELPPIPPDAVFQVGAAIAGPMKSGTRGRIWFDDAQGRQLLASITLDAADDGANWWDRDLDLSALAGRRGTLTIETITDKNADWMAWSRLRIIQRSNPFFAQLVKEADQWLPPRTLRLMDRFEEAQVTFDRTESYPDYSHFDTLEGKPAFLFASPFNRFTASGYLAMITIAGASVRFPLDPVPPASALEVAVTNLGNLGDGVRARIFIDHAGREKIFEDLLPPRTGKWVVSNLSLEKWAGTHVDLVFEASSGPKRETIGDWCAWGRLRIVPRRRSQTRQTVPDPELFVNAPSIPGLDSQSERGDADRQADSAGNQGLLESEHSQK